ncbi:MAG: ribosome recycling factor [Cyclobacteriaceae bacterium]|nr:ribosome recycling factor [Cyclobacteriaceae bacterium]
MEEIQMYLDEANEKMDNSVKHLVAELGKIRAGKAMPSMLDGITVEYYGSQTPLNQVASINTPDARTIMIKPWEKTIIHEIERAIINSDLGFNPQSDGENVIINVPALTEERRRDLVKQVKAEGENGKVSIRNARHEILHEIKALKDEGVSEDEIKRGEEKVQQLTDKHTKKVDEIIAHKEGEIMTV